MLLCNVVSVWGVVRFVLSVLHVVEGVLLWVICECFHVGAGAWCCHSECGVLCYI